MFWPGSQKFWRPLSGCGVPFTSAASGPGCQRLRRPFPGCCAPFLSAASSSGSQRLVRALPGCGVPFPSMASSPGSQGLVRTLLQARCAFSLRSPSAHRQSGLRKSSDRNQGLFAVWEGVASLGLSLPLSPPRCLLPPAGMRRLFSGISQSLCFANRQWCVQAG